MRNLLLTSLGAAFFYLVPTQAARVQAEFRLGAAPQQFSVTPPPRALYRIENGLGNIHVYPVEGNEIILHVDGVRYAERATLQVIEVEVGKLVIEVTYLPLKIVPPPGQISENYLVSQPEKGVIVKDGGVALGGRSFTYGPNTNVIREGALTIYGRVGETHLSVGVPRGVMGLKASSSLGDVLIEGLGPLPEGSTDRIIYPEVTLGKATVRANIHSTHDRIYIDRSDLTVTSNEALTLFTRKRGSESHFIASGCGAIIEDSKVKEPFSFRIRW